MPRLFLRLLILLFTTFLNAQTIPVTDNICFFQDAKTGKPITIVNDSLVYKGELKNPSILKHTEFPGKLKRYSQYNFNINKHTYLVEVGCGPVLEYRNDSIVRIDNSVLQNNQFGASPFVYKGQICLFGGYGLFTDKNIITRFDFTPKEWFLLNVNGDNVPSVRTENINYFDENGLYIFGGWNTRTGTFEKDLSLWHFNFNSLKWIRLGDYNENLLKVISKLPHNYCTFKIGEKLYIQNIDFIIEIDFDNNNICYFDNNNIIPNNQPFFNKKTNTLVYLQNLTGSSKLIIKSIPISELLKNPIKTEKLYTSPWQEFAVPTLSIILVLLLIFGIYKWRKNKKGKCFIYNQTQNKLYYKTKIIANLDPLEEKIMIYLFQNNNTYIQLNQLNSFFEKESLDNVSNVIKKRDLVFSSLLVKLNAYVMYGENPLILIQKNEVDKRIKEIKLNPLYFTLK